MQLGEIVENKFGDVFFSEVNGKSFEHQSAHTLFERYIFPRLNTEDCVYLIVGTDSGLLANAMEQRFTDNLGGRQFIFIEHPNLLACFGKLTFPSWLRIVSSDEDIIGLLQAEYLESIADDKVLLIDSIALIDGHEDYANVKKTRIHTISAIAL